jgi:hypothetical protein
MEKELRNDLIATWNELEELTANFEQLSEEEIINLLPIIKRRISDAKHWLEKYVSENDIIEDL